MVAWTGGAGMVDWDGLFWSKAAQGQLLVVFLKRLFAVVFGPGWTAFSFSRA
jgi:hypothetical protein